MKDVNYFFLVLCSVLYIGVLSACDDKETPATMNIEKVCGTYAMEQVKMTFNGVDMPALGSVSLILDTSYVSNVVETDDSRKMILELPPLWPNLPTESTYSAFENIIVKVDAAASSELVTFEGSIKKAEYDLIVKGTCQENIIVLDLTYAAFSNFIGKRYLFEFNKQSLNMGMLNPSVETVEWKGSQMSVIEFVTDAIEPVFEAIGRRLGGSFYFEVLSDASVQAGVKSYETNDFVPFSGKQAFRNLNGGFGYLVADYDGALWLSKVVLGDFSVSSTMFASIGGNLHFVPVFFVNGKSANELRIAFDTPLGTSFCRFLFQWLENLGEMELSVEEVEKAHKVALLLQDKKIRYIHLLGTVIE